MENLSRYPGRLDRLRKQRERLAYNYVHIIQDRQTWLGRMKSSGAISAKFFANFFSEILEVEDAMKTGSDSDVYDRVKSSRTSTEGRIAGITSGTTVIR